MSKEQIGGIREEIMKKTTGIALIFIILLFFLTSCAMAPPTKLQTDDKRACVQNFTYDGSFLAGRTFKTHQFVNKVSKNDAVTKAAKFLAEDGYSITNINKELGIVSASQSVSYGQGKTVPLNVTIDPVNAGVNVSISFSISGGLTANASTVQDFFCQIIEAISEN